MPGRSQAAYSICPGISRASEASGAHCHRLQPTAATAAGGPAVPIRINKQQLPCEELSKIVARDESTVYEDQTHPSTCLHHPLINFPSALHQLVSNEQNSVVSFRKHVIGPSLSIATPFYFAFHHPAQPIAHSRRQLGKLQAHYPSGSTFMFTARPPPCVIQPTQGTSLLFAAALLCMPTPTPSRVTHDSPLIAVHHAMRIYPYYFLARETARPVLHQQLCPSTSLLCSLCSCLVHVVVSAGVCTVRKSAL